MERRLMAVDEIKDALADLNGWKSEQDSLKKRFEFANFADALAFINEVGAIADSADHHPDIKLGWGYAEFAIRTHDRGGITDVDFSLAARIDSAFGDE